MCEPAWLVSCQGARAVGGSAAHTQWRLLNSVLQETVCWSLIGVWQLCLVKPCQVQASPMI